MTPTQFLAEIAKRLHEEGTTPKEVEASLFVQKKQIERKHLIDDYLNEQPIDDETELTEVDEELEYWEDL